MTEKKVLIIGASGFLGSHTTLFLLKKKVKLEVTVRTADAKKRVHTFTKLPLRQIHLVDLTEAKKIVKIVKKRYDVIINFAGFSGKQTVQDHPLESFNTNVIGLLHILEAIRKHSSQSKIILISSILQEQTDHASYSLYGIQKKTALEYFSLFKKLFNVKGTALILGNIYGTDFINSSIKEYNLVNNFMKQAVNKETLYVFGTGEQLRDYLFIEDFVELIWKVVTYTERLEQSYLVGYGTSVPFKKMIGYISQFFETQLAFKPWPNVLKKLEQGNVVIDAEHTKKTFGWYPRFSVEAGIKKCAEFLKK